MPEAILNRGEAATCPHGVLGYCDKCSTEEFKPLKGLGFIISSVAIFAIGMVFRDALHDTPYSAGEYAVLLSAYLLSGWQVLRTAFRNLVHGKVFDENFLMQWPPWEPLPSTRYPRPSG